MNKAWLSSIVIIFLLCNLTWVVACFGVYVYWNAEQLMNLAKINEYALSNLVRSGDLRISIPQPAKRDSLMHKQTQFTDDLKALETRIKTSQTTADSMDFEILLRQIKLSSFDSTDYVAKAKLAKENEAIIRQMAKIMASSAPETISKISNGLDDMLLAKIVAVSNNREAARILGALTADRVAGVTQQLTREKTLN